MGKRLHYTFENKVHLFLSNFVGERRRGEAGLKDLVHLSEIDKQLGQSFSRLLVRLVRPVRPSCPTMLVNEYKLIDLKESPVWLSCFEIIYLFLIFVNYQIDEHNN